MVSQFSSRLMVFANLKVKPVSVSIWSQQVNYGSYLGSQPLVQTVLFRMFKYWHEALCQITAAMLLYHVKQQ